MHNFLLHTIADYNFLDNFFKLLKILETNFIVFVNFEFDEFF